MAASEATVGHAIRKSGAATRRARFSELSFQLLMLLALLLALAILVVLIVDILTGAMPVLRERGWDFLRSNLSARAGRAGVWQGIVGSLQIVAITVVLAFPVGVATAIYLEEYAGDTRLSRFVDVNIRNLAGVPSVVYGLLGLAVFVELLRGTTGGRSVLSAGLTLAILALPIVIITAAEAIRAVPRGLREGGFGLGGTPWQVITQLVLPSALPGMLTGMILSLSRVIGETAPLIVVGAVTGFFAAGGAGVWESLQGPYTALPVIVFNWARQPRGDFQDVLAPAAIVVLLLFTLSANALAIYLRNRYAKRA